MRFKKGHIPWSKIHPELCKPNSGSFKKGNIPWQTGKSKKEFPQMSNSGVKKGTIPWIKNKTKERYPQLSNSGASLGHIPWNKGLIGEGQPNWRGGVSKEPYSFNFNEELKKEIKIRDNYTCQICNMTEEEHLIVYGYGLNIHHIDYNKKNCSPNNLISLCNQCHTRTNYNRDYWLNYFCNMNCGLGRSFKKPEDKMQ